MTRAKRLHLAIESRPHAGIIETIEKTKWPEIEDIEIK